MRACHLYSPTSQKRLLPVSWAPHSWCWISPVIWALSKVSGRRGQGISQKTSTKPRKPSAKSSANRRPASWSSSTTWTVSIPAELLQIFQVVKAVADFPKTIYILSYEREAVIEALGKAWHPRSTINTLKKSFRLHSTFHSQIDLSSNGLLIEHLNLHSSPKTRRTPWNEDRWREVYPGGIEDLIRTPRNLKQLINALRFAYPPVRGSRGSGRLRRHSRRPPLRTHHLIQYILATQRTSSQAITVPNLLVA